MRSATDIASARFCSTRRVAWPLRRKPRMISSTCWTSFGDSPSDGSSIKIRVPNSDMRRRLCCNARR